MIKYPKCPNCDQKLQNIQTLEGREGIVSSLGYCVNCEDVIAIRVIPFNEIVKGNSS